MLKFKNNRYASLDNGIIWNLWTTSKQQKTTASIEVEIDVLILDFSLGLLCTSTPNPNAEINPTVACSFLTRKNNNNNNKRLEGKPIIFTQCSKTVETKEREQSKCTVSNWLFFLSLFMQTKNQINNIFIHKNN